MSRSMSRKLWPSRIRVPQPVPPGPKGAPVLGSLLEYGRDPLKFLEHVGRDFGPVSYLTMAGAPVYMPNEPHLIEELLVGRHRKLVKDLPTRWLKSLVGDGLLTSEGDLWKQHRKLAAPALKASRIAEYGDTMVELAEQAVAGFRDLELRDLDRDMMELTLRVVLQTLFGVQPGREAEQVGDSLDVAMAYFDRKLHTPLGLLPEWVPPGPLSRRYMKAVGALDAIVYSVIEKRRAEHARGDDFLSRLLDAAEAEGSSLTDAQLRDESITMMLAGHETTALALTYAFYLLGTHPEPEARLHRELDRVLDGRRPTAADVDALPYTQAVVREVLRLYPPAYAIGRETTAELQLGDYTVPAGAQVIISQWVAHRDGRYFVDPDAFRPERWLEEADRPRFAYFPFGGGPRICIGNHFANMEAVLLLAAMMQRVRLSPVPGRALRLRPAITLRPAEPVRALVHRRDGATA